MMRFTSMLFSTLLSISTIQCTAQVASSIQSTSNQSGIITGADQTKKYLPYLQGKRIGMVANQSSMISKKSSIDSLVSLGIKIVWTGAWF
jgi:hypothetical protein